MGNTVSSCAKQSGALFSGEVIGYRLLDTGCWLLDTGWGSETMLNLLLQSHPVFISMESLVIIWDFRLRIYLFVEITSYLRMIYAIARLNI